MFKEDEIIVLIGAGCSMDAGIPASRTMIDNLQELIHNNHDWQHFKNLYYLLRSSIHYSDGIKGEFIDNFDIERLVNVLGELEKKENSILYPFIGSWKPRVLELAGSDFSSIQSFRSKILRQLSQWVQLQDYKKANYYKKFFELKNELNFSLRLFSLNYDLCLERNNTDNKDIELGFKDRRWDWKRFEPSENYQPDIYLYKLHGSIDWERDSNGGILRQSDKIPEEPDLIFGTDYKMQYVDPYLFFAYELRKYSLTSRIILSIGYSFRDEHITGILIQALQSDKEKRLVVVTPNPESVKEFMTKKYPKLDVLGQFVFLQSKAKDFLNELSVQKIKDILEKKNRL